MSQDILIDPSNGKVAVASLSRFDTSIVLDVPGYDHLVYLSNEHLHWLSMDLYTSSKKEKNSALSIVVVQFFNGLKDANTRVSNAGSTQISIVEFDCQLNNVDEKLYKESPISLGFIEIPTLSLLRLLQYWITLGLNGGNHAIVDLLLTVKYEL